MIAVHCGAGNIMEKNYGKYKKLCHRACLIAMKSIQNGTSALEAVKIAVMVLEDDEICNAGYGSNLTIEGKVECDAAVMDGDTLIYGGCGSVPRVKNAVALAYEICIKQYEQQPLGLVSPSLLVGNGALSHAKKCGLKIVRNKDLVTDKSMNQLKKYGSLLEEQDSLLDTVGAVCCDLNGTFAAACSSGGLLLKRPGRVGQGALYASGVWADSYSKSTEDSVAACTSGCGEHLVQTQLAKVVCEDIKTSSCPITGLSKSMTDKFINSRFLKKIKAKSAGALVLHLTADGEGSLLWGHSTESMSVGYMSLTDQKPKSLVSVLPENTIPGTTITVGGTNFMHSVISDD